MGTQCKLIVIGLDGAPIDLVQRYIDDGVMPFLGEMAQRGSWGCLRSSLPPITPVAWTSMFSGVNPGKHGVFNWQNLDPKNRYATIPTSGGHCRAPRMWDFLNACDIRCGMIGVPCTYPATTTLNGFLLPGMDAPGWNRKSAHPVSLLDDLTSTYGETPYVLGSEWVPRVRNAWHVDEGLVQGYVDRIVEIAQRTMEAHPVDVLAVVFGCTDHVGHFFSATVDTPGTLGYEAMRYTFRKADAACRRIVDLWGEEADILIVSDHGMAPIKRQVNLSQWLQERGYTRVRSNPTQWLKTAARLLLNERVRRALNRLRKRPKHAADPASIVRAASKALVWGSSFPYLQLNVRGREPAGIVEPGEEFEALREELKKELTEARDPETDQPVFTAAFTGDEAFSGPYQDQYGPDIVLEWGRGYTHIPGLNVAGPMAPPFLSPPARISRDGGHTLEGIYFGAGPGMEARGEAGQINITDIAAIALTALGIEVPAALDGKAPNWVRVADEPRKAVVDTAYAEAGSAYDDDDASTVEDRLRDLGYL